MNEERKQKIIGNLLTIKNELKSIQLVAVSKYSSLEEVTIVYQTGHFDFGESRVNDLKERSAKFQELNLSQVRWHFIGHLQTNKVRALLKIPNLVAIHSVDSLHLLEELLKREGEFTGRCLDLFLEVKTSAEKNKKGFILIDELYAAIEILLTPRANHKFKFKGLMTIAPLSSSKLLESDAGACFKKLNQLKVEIEKKFKLKEKCQLSMGMSQDYQLAIAEGADLVRIGSSIFR